MPGTMLPGSNGTRFSLAVLLTWLFANVAAAVEPYLEITEMPYHLADRLEGVYSHWGARWINGPIYRRTEASYKSDINVPVFLGPFCGHVYGGLPSSWCFAQCEEEHMLQNPGLLLPCGTPAPDGTDCPPAPPESAPGGPAPPAPQEPPPRAVICAILGHARRWHEAGHAPGLVPPTAEFWRLRGAGSEWADATSGAAPASSFLAVPMPRSPAPPGQRLGLRQDGTVRPGARSQLCLGAERGVLAEGTRLIFWDCGAPPYRHERFAKAFDANRGSFVLYVRERPSLCAVVPGAPTADAAGPPVALGLCSAAAGTRQPVAFVQAEDGTLRLGVSRELCLGTGFDRPELGSELRAGRCALPAPAPAQPLMPAAQDASAGAVLQAMQALQAGWEAKVESKLESKLERLEQEVAELRARGLGEHYSDSHESSCTALGCRPLLGSLSGPKPFADL